MVQATRNKKQKEDDDEDSNDGDGIGNGECVVRPGMWRWESNCGTGEQSR